MYRKFCGHQLNSFSYSAVNVQNKERQKGVLKNVLLSLKNDFPEIVPHFIQSGALDLTGPQIVDLVYDQLDLLDPVTLALIQIPLQGGLCKDNKITFRIHWVL